jgi:SAM-dependent methyltransferase
MDDQQRQSEVYLDGGCTYTRQRRTDPRIEARIHAALGDARTVVNVGAGTGSYEPTDRKVTAIEPSATMRAQRPPDAAPAIDARAEALPFADDSFDAAMACVTIHHWHPAEAGLAELRRVARGPVVVFTFELERLPAWQQDHLAEGLAIELPRFPSLEVVAGALGGRTRVERIPTPADCADGFFEAFWNRPEQLLDDDVRASQSMWRLLPPGAEERIVARLRADLESVMSYARRIALRKARGSRCSRRSATSWYSMRRAARCTGGPAGSRVSCEHGRPLAAT